MREGEIKPEEGSQDEDIVIYPISKIVGGNETERASADDYFLNKFEDQKSPKIFKQGKREHKLEDIERTKTPEEIVMIEALLGNLEKEFKKGFGESLKITPDHIHFIDAQKAEVAGFEPQHFFDKSSQFIGIYDTGSNLRNAEGIIHEALHFNSFHSIQLKGDDLMLSRRDGIRTRVGGEDGELYFEDINEAVISEMEKMCEKDFFDLIPGIQDELKNRKEFAAEFLQRHPDQQEFADDIAY